MNLSVYAAMLLISVCIRTHSGNPDRKLASHSYVRYFRLNSTNAQPVETFTMRKLWQKYLEHYLYHLMKDTMNNKCVYKNEQNVENAFHLFVDSFPNNVLCGHKGQDDNDALLQKPCGSIYVTTQEVCSLSWRISVHPEFMINVTIYHAYIPFTDLCSPHNIQIHEGHEVNTTSLIEQFCGHTYLENVYAQNNTGVIVLTFANAVIYKAVEMHAEYQLLDKGMADKYISNRPHSEDGHPNMLLFDRRVVRYIWYISKAVFVSTYKDTSSQFVVSYTNIILSSYICVGSTSTLSVYEGLQPSHWLTWGAQPNSVDLCNKSNEDILLSIHSMLSTLVLTRSTFGYISVTIAFSMALQQLPSGAHHAENFMSSCGEFQTYHGVQYMYATYINASVSITIASFQNNGPTPTSKLRTMALLLSSLSNTIREKDYRWYELIFKQGRNYIYNVYVKCNSSKW